MNFNEKLRTVAKEAGFSQMGICSPDSIAHAPAQLQDFLRKKYHAQMHWLSDRADQRANPKALWPDVKTIIMLADIYTPQKDPLETLSMPDKGNISVYARNQDYHDIIKKRLKAIGRWMISKKGGEIKVFVDTAPVMEKPLAAAAGLGWQGKHTNLLSRKMGNWFFLGAIFTNLTLAPTSPEENQNHCGNCRACLDICPTKAFPAPYKLDARRCISYLTIEHKGAIDPALRPALGNRIYGCDDCLAVCPWNKFAQTATQTRYHARKEFNAPSLQELAMLTDKTFRQKFTKSPIKRIGIARFLRNVLYAIGNSRNPHLRNSAAYHLNSSDKTTRDAALWAVSNLNKIL